MSLRTRCGWGVAFPSGAGALQAFCWLSAASAALWRRTRCQCVCWVSASAASILTGLLSDVGSACCALRAPPARRTPDSNLPITCLVRVVQSTANRSEPCQICRCCPGSERRFVELSALLLHTMLGSRDSKSQVIEQDLRI